MFDETDALIIYFAVHRNDDIDVDAEWNDADDADYDTLTEMGF